MRDTDCGDGLPQPARGTPDTLSIQDVGRAYLKYTCKDAAKFLQWSQCQWAGPWRGGKRPGAHLDPTRL
jgi:hypothetical protein